MKKKNILFIVIVVLLLVAAIFLYQNRYEIRSMACFPEPNICMNKLAVEKDDLSICDRMRPCEGASCQGAIRHTGLCYSDIAISRNDESLCESEILIHIYNNYIKDRCFEEIAKITQDPTLCDKMVNTSSMNCYREIALSKKDITICDKARSPEEVGRCYYSVVQKLEQYEMLSTCLTLENNESRFWCYGG